MKAFESLTKLSVFFSEDKDLQLDTEFCRSFFPPMDNGVVYLENAGGSYVPRQVIDRLTNAMQGCQNQPFWYFESSKDLTSGLRLPFRQSPS